MKKETFCRLIKAIKMLQEDRDIISDGIEKIIDGYAIVTVGDETEHTIVEVLKDEMEDKYDWISWWLYEDVEKVVFYDDGTPDRRLDTAEQLYDFLKEG